MNIVLPADPDDGPAVMRITRSIEAFSAEEKDCVQELWDDYFINGLQSPYSFCVSWDDHQDQINGFACYGIRALTESTYDLYWIAVDPSSQGSGVGSDLLRYVERKVSSLNGRTLLIETSSLPAYRGARRFYRHHHYRQAAVLRDFYAQGDDLVIYSKKLRSPSPVHNQSPLEAVKPD